MRALRARENIQSSVPYRSSPHQVYEGSRTGPLLRRGPVPWHVPVADPVLNQGCRRVRRTLCQIGSRCCLGSRLWHLGMTRCPPLGSRWCWFHWLGVVLEGCGGSAARTIVRGEGQAVSIFYNSCYCGLNYL